MSPHFCLNQSANFKLIEVLPDEPPLVHLDAQLQVLTTYEDT